MVTGKDDELSEDDASSGSDDLGGSPRAVACCPLLRVGVLLLSSAISDIRPSPLHGTGDGDAECDAELSWLSFTMSCRLIK